MNAPYRFHPREALTLENELGARTLGAIAHETIRSARNRCDACDHIFGDLQDHILHSVDCPGDEPDGVLGDDFRRGEYGWVRS